MGGIPDCTYHETLLHNSVFLCVFVAIFIQCFALIYILNDYRLTWQPFLTAKHAFRGISPDLEKQMKLVIL